jgi:hypothetical protein
MSHACSIPECKNRARARGWCSTHYTRWFKTGSVRAEEPVRAIGQQATCCDKKHYANGLCSNHYMQQWSRDNPERMAARELRRSARRLGLDADLVEAHFREHPGLCDICHRPVTEASKRLKHRLTIDHDHKTGAFRGLLCEACNRAIGFMSDDPARLRAAADYLERALAPRSS